MRAYTVARGDSFPFVSARITFESVQLAVQAPSVAPSVVDDMTDFQEPTGVEYLRCELLDRMDAQHFDDWSPALLRALIAVFDLNGVTPAAQRGFRPYLVR
jgi:hypothetical protein